MSRYPDTLRNSSSETIPACSIAKVIDSEKVDGRERLVVGKPDGSGRHVFTCPVDIAAGDTAAGTREGDPYVNYDTNSTPSAGDEWGPVNDSWVIGPTGTGVTIIGDAAGGKVRVRLSAGEEKFRLINARVTASATQGASFTVDQVVAEASGTSPTNTAVATLTVQSAKQAYTAGASVRAVYVESTGQWNDVTDVNANVTPIFICEADDGFGPAAATVTVVNVIEAIGGPAPQTNFSAANTYGLAAASRDTFAVVPDGSGGYRIAEVFRRPMSGPFVMQLSTTLQDTDASMGLTSGYDTDDGTLSASLPTVASNPFNCSGQSGDRVLVFEDTDGDSGQDYIGVVPSAPGDATDTPNAYEIRLASSKQRNQPSVTAQILAANGTPSGQVVVVHDIAGEFSTGFATGALGVAVESTDPTTGATRFTLVNLEGPAIFVSGVLTADSSSGEATASIFSSDFSGPAWNQLTPAGGSIVVTGLTDGEDTQGSAFSAQLENPDAFPVRYRKVGGGGGVETFECLILPGNTVTAASYNEATRTWVNGSGQVTLLNDTATAGTYDYPSSGAEQDVEWQGDYAVGASTNEAHRGWGTIEGGRYILRQVDTCNDANPN